MGKFEKNIHIFLGKLGMKILPSLILVTTVLGQQTSESAVDELERGKKKKKDDGYTTRKPTTTKPGPYAPGGGSSGYGDPHFHILGRSLAQPSLCFDYNDLPEKDLVLIQDNNSGLQVIGNLFQPDTEENGNGWDIQSSLNVQPSFSWHSEQMTYGDLIVGDVHRENHGGHKMTVTIVGGITFEIHAATAHGNVNFKLVEHSNLSNDVHGIIGRFLPEGAYEVIPDDYYRKIPKYGDTGSLHFGSQELNVTYQRHAHNKDCWTLKEMDAFVLINTQD